jgi:hypothetical protein
MILMKSDGAVVTCSAAALRRSPESLVVTDEDARKLQRALPECEVVR